MSSAPSPPAAPNYQPLADASAAAARESAQISREQLQWAKDQYAQNKPFSDRVKNTLANTLDENSANARKDRARYEDIYQPLEDKAVSDANTYASDDNKSRMRGRAMGTVGQTFDAAGAAARRSLEGFGVDPSSTRMAALDIGVKTQRAAAQAAAGNNSDLAVEATGRQMRDQAINVGKGYPAQVANSYNTGTGAGTAGVGAQNSTYSAAAPALGNPTAWAGLSNQSLGTWGNVLSSMYGTQMQGYAAQQNSSSGIGAALGGLGGLIGGVSGFFKDGGEVPSTMPGVAGAGEAVPPGASPSGGTTTDDVPASVNGSMQPQAAINVGEFIMPKRTVEFYGTQKLRGMIEQADKKMGIPVQHVGPTPSPGVQRAALPV